MTSAVLAGMLTRILSNRSVIATRHHHTGAVPILSAVLLALGAGCASAPADGEASDALANAHAQTTVLVSKSPASSSLQLSFGLDQERRPVAIASRGGKKTVLTCTSTVEVSAKPDWVWIECSHAVREGEDCYIQLKRSAATEFTMNLGCEGERNGQPVALAPELAATYEIVTGEPAPSGPYDSGQADRYRIALLEARRGAEPFGDVIAYAEALAPSMKSLLGQLAIVKHFDGTISDVPVGRVMAHPNQAKRVTQLAAFAGPQQVEVKELSVEGAGGKFVTGAEVLARVKSHGLCSDAPAGAPHCLK